MNDIWNYLEDNNENIYQYTKKFIEKSQENNKKFMNMKFDNKNDLFIALELLENDISEYISYHSVCNFMAYISVDNKTKQLYKESDMLLSGYLEHINMNNDIYNKIIELYDYGTKNKLLGSTEDTLIKKIIEGYIRNGVKLSNKEKDILIRIKKQIIKLENEIHNKLNIFESSTYNFIENDLNGMPENIKDSLQYSMENNIKKYKIKIDKSNYNLCMNYINNSSVRKDIDFIFHTKYVKNIDELFRLFLLKDRYSKILSYENYMEYKTRNLMIMTPDAINKFMSELFKITGEKFNKEINLLKKYTNNKTIGTYDLQYYILKSKRDLKYDDKEISEYFPLTHVIKKTHIIYQQLFDISFVETKKYFKWHNDIKTYNVIYNNQIIGCFYIDIYARENKFGYTKCFQLQHGNNKYISILALIASFPKNKCVLLSINDVVCYFREFGRMIIEIYNVIGSKYSLLNLGNMEDDFIDIPVLLMENICMNKDILKDISCHYKTKKKIDDDMIEKIIKIKKMTISINTRKQMINALYDQIIYSSREFLDGINDIIINIYPKNNNIGIKKGLDILSNINDNLQNYIYENKICVNKHTIVPMSWINYINNTDGINYISLWSKIISCDIYDKRFSGCTYTSDIKKMKSNDIRHKMIEFKNIILLNDGTLSGNQVIEKYIGNYSFNGFTKLYDIFKTDDKPYDINDINTEGYNDNDNEYNESVDNDTNRYYDNTSESYIENDNDIFIKI